jgi:hypothetical protein
MSEILEEKLLMLIKQLQEEKVDLGTHKEAILKTYKEALEQVKQNAASAEKLALNAQKLTDTADKLSAVRFPEEVRGYVTHTHQVKEGKWWLYGSLAIFVFSLFLFGLDTLKNNEIDTIYAHAKHVDSLSQLKLTAAQNKWLMNYQHYMDEKYPKTSAKFISEHPYPKDEK